ncbi:NAD(P)H-binding protein [Agromyces bauzanensis]
MSSAPDNSPEAATTTLIIGGTGKVGRRVAAELEARGEHVRVASRNRGDIRFDWHDPSTFAPALAGTDAVFIVGPGSATDWSPLLAQLLDAAAAAGTRRAVLLSARAVEFLPDGAVDRAERVLRDGPVEWTILRPAHFAQNFTEAMFTPVDDHVTAPVGDGREPFIDVADIADVAAAALTTTEWEGETLELSGPTAITFEEAVGHLGSAQGRRITFSDEPLAEHVGRLRAASTPEGYITWRSAMLAAIRSGADAYLSHDVERVLGRPATSFESWARSELAV